MTTVFVDATDRRRPREIARDARNPLEQTAAIEKVADSYSSSRPDRRILVFADDRYVTPWRKRQDDPLYESIGGQATPDFRTVAS